MSQFSNFKMTSSVDIKLEPDFENSQWIERHRFLFDFLDINKNGKITLDDVMKRTKYDICEKFDATPEQTQRHQECVEAFFKKAGMEYGKEVAFQEYLEGWKVLAISDLEKLSRNESTLIGEWGDAIFDIFDKDGSGSITLDEWKVYGKISGISVSEEDFEATFKHCDMDNSGEIDADELTKQHLGFWYTLDPNAVGLYGAGVP